QREPDQARVRLHRALKLAGKADASRIVQGRDVDGGRVERQIDALALPFDMVFRGWWGRRLKRPRGVCPGLQAEAMDQVLVRRAVQVEGRPIEEGIFWVGGVEGIELAAINSRGR